MVRELLNRSTPPKLCQSPSEMAGRSTPLFPQRWYAMVSYRASAGRRGIVGRISCIARCTLRQDRYVSVASNRVPVPTAFRSVSIVLAAVGAFPPVPSLAQAAPRTGDWPAYGHDAGGTRYSPLAEITPGNVARLRVAWVYRTGDYLRDRSRFEAAPLVVDGTLYVSTPLGHVIALDPERGIERWRYDARVSLEGDYGDFANRGVATWLDQTRGTALPCRRRIFLATVDARLIALDARTGRPCGDFGAGGEVDLAGGVADAPAYHWEYGVTSPPAVASGLVIVGAAVSDNQRVDAPEGVVRAFDARSGRLRWGWGPVPPPRSARPAPARSVPSTDPERDLVFVPTGSVRPDFVGGVSPGANAHANSVVALRASTGRLVWAFQVVHQIGRAHV